MLDALAALGLGIMTAAAAPTTTAAHLCGPGHAHPTGYGAPTYTPAPTYAPPPAYTPAPTYTPAPHYPSQPTYSAPRGYGRDAADAAVSRRADYNRDGGISLYEAHDYARGQFARADIDRNGVLTRREQRNTDGAFERARGRDGVVTLAEYDTTVRRDFYNLDRNRDGVLTRAELRGHSAPRHTVSYSWHWQL